MKNKDFKKALQSDKPINSMFALIPEKQKKPLRNLQSSLALQKKR